MLIGLAYGSDVFFVWGGGGPPLQPTRPVATTRVDAAQRHALALPDKAKAVAIAATLDAINKCQRSVARLEGETRAFWAQALGGAQQSGFSPGPLRARG